MQISLDGLPPAALAALRSRMIRRSFRRGDTLVYQGDPSSSIYFVESGHVAVKVGSAEGLSVTLTLIGPHESFGELAGILGEGSRTATVVALDNVTASILGLGDFGKLRAQQPEIDRLMLVALAMRVQDLSDRLVQTQYESVQRRCGRRLLEAAEMFAEPGSEAVVVPITQDDLAGMTGATRPTVNQALGQLGDEGIVRVSRGRIEVVRIAALRAHVR